MMRGYCNLPLIFQPAATGTRWSLILPPAFDRRMLAFSGLVIATGWLRRWDRAVGAHPIGLWGESSL